MGLVFRHPEPGEMVGDYRIVEKVGSGGFGTVFKAERGGLFFAVKMLRSHELRARARREISILLELEHPCVARFRACDRWLDPKTGTPYIVTDFVPGMTLKEHAEEENPSARESARIILETARTFGEVHLQGVFHRDLKPENLIIPGKNERPILIDFGVGLHVGARIITPFGLPQGTYEYRSPEAYLFNRANIELAHYEFSAVDELWALGVIFYWLLTDILPFGDRNNEEGGGLAERIIHQRPLAPHVLNSRVPRVLSDLCMKMLEKKPEDRYPSVAELCTALEDVLAGAKADSSWNLPLFDPDAPDTRTTEEDPALVDVNEDEEIRMLRKWARAPSRRGRKPKKKPAEQAPAPAPGVPGAVPEQVPAVAVVPAPGPVPPEPVVVPAIQAPAEAPRAEAAPPPPGSLRRPRLLASAGLAAVVVGAFLFAKSLIPPGSAPPGTSSEVTPTQEAGLGHELAQSANPLDPRSGEGAEPTMGSITAPVMITMLSKDDTRETPQEKKTKVFGRATKVISTGFVCTTLSGCPAPQVRPTPQPAPCPAGAVEAMADKLGIHVGQRVPASLIMEGPTGDITVREGPTSAELGPTSLFGPGGYILLSGMLTMGEDRVFGRFTQAHNKENGETFPVCFEMWDLFKHSRGAVFRERNGGPDSARIYSTVQVEVVDKFE